MSLSSVRFGLRLGAGRPEPAPAALLDRLDAVSVEHSDKGVSGFQLDFLAGRSRGDVLDDPVAAHELLAAFTRVQITVTVRGVVYVLMDGFITQHQYTPSEERGGSRFTVTGEDVSFMMDRVALPIPWACMSDSMIAAAALAKYSSVVTPEVIPAATEIVKFALDRGSSNPQRETDRAMLNRLASRNGYVFYVRPGDSVGQNVAYWGPPIRSGEVQDTLTWGMGGSSNLRNVSFTYSPANPRMVAGYREVEKLTLPVVGFPLRIPLSARPSHIEHIEWIGVEWDQARGAVGGIEYMDALLEAQGRANESTDQTVTATGELDTLLYDGILQARGLVRLRGVGDSYDGVWYVQRVTHAIRRGEYRQQFTLNREGLGAQTGTVASVTESAEALLARVLG